MERFKNSCGALAVLSALALTVPAFANTPTPNYSLNVPSIGADADNWGVLDNANWNSLDSIIFGIQGTANAACPKAGCSFTGQVNFGNLPSFSALVNSGKPTLQFGANVYAQYDPGSGALFLNSAPSQYVYLDASGNLHTNTGAFVGPLTGNASTASKWATGRTIAFTGDVSGTTAALDGSANLTGQTLTLATVNSGPGACGDATHVCAVTTNGKGLVTAQSATAIATATGAQVITGTDNAHFVTPASLTSQQAQSVSCGTNCTGGYVTLPGGVIMQWGHYDTGANAWNGSGTPIAFPLTFPNGCLSFVGMTDNQSGAGSPRYALQASSACGTGSITVSAAGYQSAGANNIHGFYWVAYGN